MALININHSFNNIRRNDENQESGHPYSEMATSRSARDKVPKTLYKIFAVAEIVAKIIKLAMELFSLLRFW